MDVTKPLVYDSRRPRVAIWEDAVELMRYRNLLWSLVRRDLTVRYKRSALGFLWTMLNPLLTMLVQSIVFSTIFRFSIEHYAVYLLSGLLLWNFFSQSTTQSIHSLMWGSNLINKVYIPKAVFVVSETIVGLVNFLLALLPLALIMLLTGQPFSPALLFLPVPFLLATLFTLGVGLFFAALAVFFADIVNIFQVGLTVLMYLTPLFYPIDIVPPQYLIFVQLNPVYYLVSVFRDPISAGRLPEPGMLAIATVCAVTAFVVGWWFFTSKADEFAYRI